MRNHEGSVKNCPVIFSCKFEMQKSLMVSQFLHSVTPKDATTWGNRSCDASYGSSTLREHTLSSHLLILAVSGFFHCFLKPFQGNALLKEPGNLWWIENKGTTIIFGEKSKFYMTYRKKHVTSFLKSSQK